MQCNYPIERTGRETRTGPETKKRSRNENVVATILFFLKLSEVVSTHLTNRLLNIAVELLNSTVYFLKLL